MKRKYIKPQITVSRQFTVNPVIAASWTVDGKKDPTNGDGGEIIEDREPGELDARKNNSGWNFEW